jgi:hypothetical protein
MLDFRKGLSMIYLFFRFFFGDEMRRVFVCKNVCGIVISIFSAFPKNIIRIPLRANLTQFF